MYLRKPKHKRGVQTCETYVWIEDDEIEVTVEYETSPAEPDVNWAGGMDICTVTDSKGNDIYDKISSVEMDNLIDRVTEWENDVNDPYNDPHY